MSGVSVFDIKSIMGHSDIRTTMRYMHLSSGHLSGKTDVLMRELERNSFDIENAKENFEEKTECSLKVHSALSVSRFLN